MCSAMASIPYADAIPHRGGDALQRSRSLVFACVVSPCVCLLLCVDDERDELPAAALSATMTTPLTPRGAPLSHANSSSAAAALAAAALTPPPTALGSSFAGPAGGTPAAAAADVGHPRPTGAFGTPQQSSSFARSAAVAAAAAAGGVGPATPAGGVDGEGSQRQMLSTPSFTHLRELWGQLSPEEVQERLSLAGGCVKHKKTFY